MNTRFAVTIATLMLVAGVANARGAALQCARTDAGLTDANIAAITKAIETQMGLALGPTWASFGPAAGKKVVDPGVMADLAKAAGCAAVIDAGSSCAMFYDPEFSTTLGVITALPKRAPLRMQFEGALKGLADAKQKAAAQTCMSLVAAKQ
ncbi:MAG: hypothetical protein ACJ8GW_05325 [Massilia sp.]